MHIALVKMARLAVARLFRYQRIAVSISALPIFDKKYSIIIDRALTINKITSLLEKDANFKQECARPVSSRREKMEAEM